MANYFEIEKLEALIPATWLLGALDDDGNGTAEMFEEARTVAEEEINGHLGLRYELPLDPVPLFVQSVALYLAAELCYARRGEAEAFPFKDKVENARSLLTKIAEGKVPLYPKSDGGSKAKGAAKAYVGVNKVHSDRTNA